MQKHARRSVDAERDAADGGQLCLTVTCAHPVARWPAVAVAVMTLVPAGTGAVTWNRPVALAAVRSSVVVPVFDRVARPRSPPPHLVW